MSAFTPGPWEVTPHTDDAEVVSIVCGDHSVANWVIECESGDDSAIAENIANAHLVAAAPYLYAACRALVEHYEGYLEVGSLDPDEPSPSPPQQPPFEAILRARAALWQAEGK